MIGPEDIEAFQPEAPEDAVRRRLGIAPKSCACGKDCAQSKAFAEARDPYQNLTLESLFAEFQVLRAEFELHRGEVDLRLFEAGN